MLALPLISDIDLLPDGRSLVELHGGSVVVVGRAQPYPHPVPGCDWLPSRVRSRPRRVVHQPRRQTARQPRRLPATIRILEDARARRPSAPARAEALLRSLLTPAQLQDWESDRHFWVETPRGPVRLGDLYWLTHWPVAEPDLERHLCVVPNLYRDLPRADIWVNLLLVLAVEPETFFRVAIERDRCRRPAPCRATPPD